MRYLTLIFILLATTFVWSQQMPFEFKGRISNTDNGGYEAGVTVSAIQNGSTVLTTQSASNGKYALSGNLDFSQPFEIVFSKSGIVSKMVRFDFSKANQEDFPPGSIRPLEDLSIEVFQDRPDIDFSFLNSEPVASFDWDTRELHSRLDQTGAAAMRKKIADLLVKAEQEAFENEKNYQEAINAANTAYDAKNYEEALGKYEEALGYKPKEKLPADRIVELDALIKAQKEKELAEKQGNQEYDNLISAADNLRSQEKLAEAVTKYKEASAKKPTEQYPKDQVAELEKRIEQIKKEKENQAAYDEAMKMGEIFFKQSSWKAARDKFTEATGLKPSEKLPKDRLAEIAKKLEDAEAAEAIKQKYTDAIAAADKAFNEEDFATAKTKYEEALTFESASSYAKGRLQICNDKLAADLAAQAKLKQIEDLLKQGQTALDAKKFDEAIGKYDEVLALDAANVPAKEKKELAAKLKAEAEKSAAADKQFNDLVAQGDQAFAAKKYQDAISKFEEALALKNDAGVDTKLKDARAKLAEEQALAQKGEAFKALIESGNQLLADGKLEESKAKFQEAAKIDQTSTVPSAKITEIDALIAAKKANESKQAQYDAAIAAADQLFNASKWSEAKAKYEEAVPLATDPTYAKGRIEEVKKKLAEDAEAAERLANYEANIKAADAAFAAEKWSEAKSKYEAALKLTDDKTYAQGRLDTIAANLNNAAAEAERKEKYEAAIKAADKAFDAKNWTESKTKYLEALGLTSEGAYAQGRIDSINTTLANEQAAKEKSEKIASMLSEASDLYSNKKLEDARSKYQEVLTIDNANDKATSEIAKINAELASMKSDAEKNEAFAKLRDEGYALADSKKYDQAKAKLQEALSLKTDPAVQTRLDEIIKIQKEENQAAEEINSLLLDGEALFNAKKYSESKKKYEAVLAKESNNTVAKSQLEKIEQALNKQENEAAQLEAFNTLKTQGLALKNQEKFTEAKAKLNEALGIKEDAEIRSALAAIAAKEQEALSGAEKLAEYKAALEEGKNLENAGQLEDALKKYEAAKQILPTESEPDALIKAVNVKINQAKELARIDKEYNDLIILGDKLVSEEKYVEAIKAYNDALKLKPAEQLPVDKANAAEELARNSSPEEDRAVEKNLRIAEQKIDKGEFDRATEILNSTESLVRTPERIAEIKSLRDRITAAKKLEADYAKFIKAGADKFAAKDYDAALSNYKSALGLKPNEQMPKDRIAEIEALQNDKEAIARRDAMYREYMDKGAKHIADQEYQLALSDYQNALTTKANDQPAKDKISEVQQILDDIANKGLADLEKKSKFSALISEADKFFSVDEYLSAKSKYEEALKLYPNDNYAKTRVDECLKRENDRTNEQENEAYRRLIEAADKNFNNGDYTKAKERYSTAVTFRSSDPYPKKKLAEIDAILNPASVASLELKDPGVRIDGSILDGQSALQQAELERNALEKQRLKRKLDSADVQIEAISFQKGADREKARYEIDQEYRNANAYSEGADMEREENVQVLQRAAKELEDANAGIGSMDYRVNVTDQTQLNVINENVQMNYGERSEVYRDNAKTMDSYELALSEAMRLQGESDYGSNITSDQKLITYKETIRTEMIDDFEERDGVRQKVNDISASVSEENRLMDIADYEANHKTEKVLDDIQAGVISKQAEDAKIASENNKTVVLINDKIANTSSDLGSSETEDVYRAKKEINNIEIKYSNKSVEDAEAIASNGEELRLISNEINSTNQSMGAQETQFAYGADRQMEAYKQRMVSDQSGMDNNRKETVEILKENNNNLAVESANDAYRFAEKSLANKSAIDRETELNSNVGELADEAHDLNVAGIEKLDNKARANYSGVAMSDDEERLNARKGVENIYSSASEKGLEDAGKQAENAVTINQSKRVIDSEVGNRGDENMSQSYDAANKIHNIDTKPEEKPIIANSLGEEYEEGVTEESFAENDQNGLMKSIITRRIVVIQGHADVYLRTQSLNAITYSKNGKAITEHDWNSQTQGPNLVRHTK